MEKLLTTEKIAEMYGVSNTTITNNWCNKGLKFIRSKNSFLFKETWVEEYLEKQAEENVNQRHLNQKHSSVNITVKTRAKRKFNYAEMKII